jgi:hypothetical protein
MGASVVDPRRHQNPPSKAPAVHVTEKTPPPQHHNAPKQPSSAKAQHTTSQQGQQRSDPPTSKTPVDIHPNLALVPEFRFVVAGKILDNVESCSWDDNNAIMRGQLVTRDQEFDRTPPPAIDIGTVVRCDVDQGGGFSELWRMRVSDPQLTVSDQQHTFTLANDLDLLLRSEGMFAYPAGAMAGPVPTKQGLYGHDIIKDVCKRFHVKIGRLYKGTRRMRKAWSQSISPIDVIRYVVKRERQLTGRRLVVKWKNNSLYVVPFVRNPKLLGLGPTLIEAAFQQGLAPEFASAMRLYSINAVTRGYRDKKGRKKTKPAKNFVDVASSSSVRRFGYVRRVLDSPDATTQAMLLKEAQAYLAYVAKPIKKLTLTHTGMPRLERGDAIKLQLGDAGLRNQIVWVYAIHNELAAGSYQQQITVIFDDPYVDDKGRSILWKLRETAAEAKATAGPNWGLGSPNKNDSSADPSGPSIWEPTPVDPGGGNAAGNYGGPGGQ